MFSLNPRDTKPIYLQIKEQYIRFITSGVLGAGEKLPSVRQLASQLSINPNTLQRAYAELETEGYCYSQAGRGSFVAAASAWDTSRRDALTAQLQASAAELRTLGVTDAELIALVSTREDENK